MVGILVHGENHFILSGPPPDEAAALAMARYWSIIQIGDQKSLSFEQWQIRTKEFRENLNGLSSSRVTAMLLPQFHSCWRN
jgi:hypothetical protein